MPIQTNILLDNKTFRYLTSLEFEEIHINRLIVKTDASVGLEKITHPSAQRNKKYLLICLITSIIFIFISRNAFFLNNRFYHQFFFDDCACNIGPKINTPNNTDTIIDRTIKSKYSILFLVLS